MVKTGPKLGSPMLHEKSFPELKTRIFEFVVVNFVPRQLFIQ